MRGFALALLLTLAISGFPQDWRNVGQIESIQYQNPVRSADGRTVEGTEYFHLEYKVSIRVVPTAEVKEDAGGPLRCVQECLGKVHKRHAECTPGTCDKQCTKNHQREIRGEYKPNIPNMRAARADSGRLARAAGAGLGPDHWSSATSSALREIKEDAEDLHTVRMGHSDKACGILHGWHQLRKSQVFVKGEFRKVGYYRSRGKDTPIDRPAGTHEKMVAETWIPQPEPSRTDEGWACHCFIPDQPKVTQTAIVKDGPTKIPGPTRTPTYSGLGWRQADGTIVIPDPTKVTVKAVGDGISSVQLVIENKTEQDLICTTEPGTVCDPKDSNTQIVALMAAMDFIIKAGSTTEIRLSDGGRNGAELSVRAACIEMQKVPPTAKNILEMRPNSDDALAALAAKASRSLAPGPVDQARIWLYTDKATLAEMNERMSPGITAGQYVDALYDLERIGGVDVSDPKYRRCFEVTLLPAEGASADAITWFTRRLLEFDGMALGTYIYDKSDAWGTKLDTSDRTTIQHYGRILGALSNAKINEVRFVGMQLIIGMIPDANKADVARTNALDNLSLALASNVDKEVELAIGVVAGYKAFDFLPTLAFLSEKGATERIRKMAEGYYKLLSDMAKAGGN